MGKIDSAIHEIQNLDTLSQRDQWVNYVHPLTKLIVTIVYIITAVSFNKYSIVGLAGMVIYPFAMFQLSELSFKECLKRIKVILPIVCLIGIMNPIFDRNMIMIGSVRMSAGVISMITLIMKGVFTVLASYILIATTSVQDICYAFRLLHMPKILTTQFLLTYRYISVLLAEANRITQAYSLRAPNQKGVHFKVWGSLTGQLLLRSIDRANTVYDSMLLRGFTGEFINTGKKIKFKASDCIYMLIWIVIFMLTRRYPLFIMAGELFGGLF